MALGRQAFCVHVYREVDLAGGEAGGCVKTKHECSAFAGIGTEGVIPLAFSAIRGGYDVVGKAVEVLQRFKFRAQYDQRFVGFEHNRRAAAGGDLGSGGDDDSRHEAGGKSERDVGPGRLRRIELNAEQLEELDVVEVGNLIQAIQDHLRHPRKQLSQRDAGVGLALVSPCWRVTRDEQLGLGNDLVKGAIIEDGRL